MMTTSLKKERIGKRSEHRKFLCDDFKRIDLSDGLLKTYVYISWVPVSGKENKNHFWIVQMSKNYVYDGSDVNKNKHDSHVFKWPGEILKGWNSMTFESIENIFIESNPHFNCKCPVAGATIPSFLCYLSSVCSIDEIPKELDVESYHHMMNTNTRFPKKRSPRRR